MTELVKFFLGHPVLPKNKAKTSLFPLSTYKTVPLLEYTGQALLDKKLPKKCNHFEC